MTDAAPDPYRKLIIRRDAVAEGALPDGLAVGDRLDVTLFGTPSSGPGTVTAVDGEQVTIEWGDTPPAPPPAAVAPHRA